MEAFVYLDCLELIWVFGFLGICVFIKKNTLDAAHMTPVEPG